MPAKAKAKAVLLQDFGYDNFPVDDEAPTPRLVIANVGNENYSKRAFMHTHSGLQDSFDSVSQDVPQRPRTSNGVAGRERKLSVFSRPLTSYECETRRRDSSRPSTATGIPRKGSGGGVDASSDNIGVALGSPTHLVMDTNTLDATARRPPYLASNESVTTLHGAGLYTQPDKAQRLKPTRWKSVSNLFSRKKSTPSKPPSIPSDAQSLHSVSTVEPTQSSGSWPRRRSSSKSGSISLRRSTKTKIEDLPPMPTLPPPPTRPPPRPDLVHAQSAPSVVETSPLLDTAQRGMEYGLLQATPRKRDSRPQLDVDIPIAKFERFSVMFSDLPQLGSMTKVQARTSILERRNRSSRMMPLPTVAQELSPELVSEPFPSARTDSAILHERPKTSGYVSAGSAGPPPQRTASTRTIAKGPAYSLFPRTSKTPQPTMSMSPQDPLPLESNPLRRSRSLTTLSFSRAKPTLTAPNTAPPPKIEIFPDFTNHNDNKDIDDMINFLESSAPKLHVSIEKSPLPVSRSAPSLVSVADVTTPPDSPVLKAFKPHHSPHQPSPTHPMVLPPSPSTLSSGDSSPDTSRSSAAYTIDAEQEHDREIDEQVRLAVHVTQALSSHLNKAVDPYPSKPSALDIPTSATLQSAFLTPPLPASRTFASPNPHLSPTIDPRHCSTASPTLSASSALTRSPGASSSHSTIGPGFGYDDSPVSPLLAIAQTVSVVQKSNDMYLARKAPGSFGADAANKNTNGSVPATAAGSRRVVELEREIQSRMKGLNPLSAHPTSGPGSTANFAVPPSASPAAPATAATTKSQTTTNFSLPNDVAARDAKTNAHLSTTSWIHPPSELSSFDFYAFERDLYSDLQHSPDPDTNYSPDPDAYAHEHWHRADDAEEEIGRKSGEGIVRCRTPTFIEVDGGPERGVVGLGLGLGGGTLGGPVAGASGKRFEMKRGRSVEGLLEVV